MAVLFSAVTVTAGDQEKEFLVRGIGAQKKIPPTTKGVLRPFGGRWYLSSWQVK